MLSKSRYLVTVLALFFGAATVAVAQTYQVVVMPDTQNYSGHAEHQPIFSQQTAWIAENIESENIVFVTQLGDVVGHIRTVVPIDRQWPFADSAFNAIDGKVPYSVAYGNHDYDQFPPPAVGATTRDAQAWFGAARYADYDWFGGASPDGGSFYQVFQIGDIEIVHLAMRFRPEEADLNWAKQVLDQHPRAPAILSTHSYLQDAGAARGGRGEVAAGRTAAGEFIWEHLVNDNDQVFMTIAGHSHAGANVEVSGEFNEDGEYHQVSKNASGRDVYEFLADYQDYPNGGDGWMQLFEFDLENNRLNVRTYSPSLDAFQDDANSRFSVEMDFDDRLRRLERN